MNPEYGAETSAHMFSDNLIYEMEKENSELMRNISRIEGDIPPSRRSALVQ